MAKVPPTTAERFVIHAETSKEGMGHVLAELTKMGLANVGYELITDIVTFRKNGARKLHDVTGDDFARAYIQENASFAAKQMVKHFTENDRTGGSAYTALRNLLEKGEIKKLSAGNYQRAGVKALAPPATKPSAANGKKLKRPPNKIHQYEIGNKDVILKRIKGRARFTLKELRDHFSNIRRNPHSVSPIVSKLFHAKVITQLEDGVYAWGTKKKIAVRKKRAAPVAQASSERTDG